MNTQAHTIHKLIALPLLLTALLPAATTGIEQSRPVMNGTLAQQIAEQGNRALLQIHAESRLALQQRLSLPALPAPETAAR